MLLDNTQIQLTGRWQYHINPIIPNQFRSFHATNHSGDFAALNFTGTAIEVFGLVGPRNGNYSVSLDDAKISFSRQAATIQQASLFSQENLDASRIHQLVITNEIEGRLLTIDLLNITQSASTGESTSNSRISRGAIAAISLVAALCITILAGSLVYLLLRRKRRISGAPQRHSEEFFRPRMGSIMVPSENLEERYPGMRNGNTTLEQRADFTPGSQPYDPPPQRQPVHSIKPSELEPTVEESYDDVDGVTGPSEKLAALRPQTGYS